MEKINIINSTDLHGFLLGDKYFSEGENRHGLLHFYEYIKKQQKREDCETLFIDNGDLFSGSHSALFAHSNQYLGKIEPIIEVLNDLNCLFTVIGNHEFDLGVKCFSKIIKNANFPYLSANVISKTKNIDTQKYLIHTSKKGTRIAFIGLTTLECHTLVRKKDLSDFEIQDTIKALDSTLKEVKKEGVHFVVLSYHGGYDEGLSFKNKDLNKISSAFIDRFPEINLFITGHTHCELINHTINATHTLQASCFGKKLASIDIEFDKNHNLGNISSTWLKAKEKPFIPDYLQSFFQQAKTWLIKEITTTTDSCNTNRLIDVFIRPNKLMQVIHTVMKKETGADIAVAHFWRKFFWDKSVKIRRLDIIDMVPPNYLSVVEINGAVLKQALENSLECFSFNKRGDLSFTTRFYMYDIFSDISFKADLTQPIGNRVISLRFRGKVISTVETFKLAMYHFRLTGAFGYSCYKNSKVIKESSEMMITLLTDYLTEYSLSSIEEKQDWELNYGNSHILDVDFLQ